MKSGRFRLFSRKFETLSTYIASYLVNRLLYRVARLPAGPFKVIVFKLDNAGDVVLSSLVMPRVAEMLGAEIVYVVKKGLGGLLEHVDCVSEVVEVPSGLGHCSRVGEHEKAGLRTSKEMIKRAIAEHRPAVIIDLRPTALGNYGALKAFYSGARVRTSLERERLKEILGRDKLKWLRHEAETFCLALQGSGLLPEGAQYGELLTFWNVPRKEIITGRYFLLQPGAVWEFKRWPERHYADLMDSLSRYYVRHSFVLAGSSSEMGVCERVCALASKRTRERTINMAGKTSISDLVSMTAGADMVIANDSGVAHIAGAAGVRTVVFFGPSSPERFKPLSERQDWVKVFHHKLPCNPCDQFICVQGPSSYCLARIDPKDVIEYIRSVLPIQEDQEPENPAGINKALPY